jgi:hypothetical protein
MISLRKGMEAAALPGTCMDSAFCSFSLVLFNMHSLTVIKCNHEYKQLYVSSVSSLNEMPKLRVVWGTLQSCIRQKNI